MNSKQGTRAYELARPKYSVHLFAGGGGGILADLLDGITPVCAVEIMEYQRSVLALRFPKMPIWDDVRTFRADNPDCAGMFADLREHADDLVLLADFPAKIFHARAKAREYAEKEADFGRNMRASFAKYDPVSCLWKIPHFLFQEDWDTYSATWPRWGMMVRGECYPLPPWERDTGATVFGELSGGGIEGDEAPARFFGTSTCRPQPRSAKFRRSTPNLGEVVEEENARLAAESAWATPTVHGNGNRSEYGGKSGDGLDTAVKRATESAPWPTPCATDHKGAGNGTFRDRLDYAVERGKTKSHTYPTVGTQTMGGCSGSFNHLKKLVEIGRQPPEDARGMAGGMKSENGEAIQNAGMLNPDWVEWLMGWPLWWTDVDFYGERAKLPWLDLADDPAEWPTPLLRRITTRKTHRVHRIETLGNGQVPLCAAVAFVFGFEILRVVIEGRRAA